MSEEKRNENDEIEKFMDSRQDKTLNFVREIGFDQLMALDRMEERIYFLGFQSRESGREEGAHATEEAVLEFITYWENQIRVARDYLANGRENRSHRWQKAKTR
jgi:hypothetical protein